MSKAKKILVLGAGLVAGPLVNYLVNKGFYVTVASKTLERAQNLLSDHKKGKAVYWEASNQTLLKSLIAESDLVISILPFEYHTQVAKLCIANKKHMVTGSYMRADLAKLQNEAIEAGVLILCECGLDPGVDHMSAKRIIDTVQGFGGKVTKFYSFCGALPTPTVAAENPMQYKFSWSPSGVLHSANREARYLRNNQIVSLDTHQLLKNTFTIKWPNIGELEVYANGDALEYKVLYGLEYAQTMFKGTLRYPGWCQSMDALKSLGLLKQHSFGLRQIRPSQLLMSTIGLRSGKDIKQKTLKWLEADENDVAIKNLDYLGFFDDHATTYSGISAFEILRTILVDKMLLKPEERDMSLLQHLIMAEYPDGRHEVITSRLLDYGLPETETSIARTVGLPLACAAKMILDSEIEVKGVHIPILPAIYNPILIELENEGLELVEDYGLPLSFDIFQ